MIKYKWNSLPRDLIKYDHANKLSRIIYWLCCHSPELFYSVSTQQFNGVPLCTAFLFTKKDIQVAENANKGQFCDLNFIRLKMILSTLLFKILWWLTENGTLIH
ncbi:hypothetical protein RDI58_016516 [Solanum bulbocastanum]|uniref:Uncharacterized protein n=1 Tax=Solanum bulbocastanum TaxID=147425 RepID=A0AAN8YDU2_SOLBU